MHHLVEDVTLTPATAEDILGAAANPESSNSTSTSARSSRDNSAHISDSVDTEAEQIPRAYVDDSNADSSEGLELDGETALPANLVTTLVLISGVEG